MGGKWEESGNYVIMFKNSQSKKAKKREAKQKKNGGWLLIRIYLCGDLE